jgi:phenylacetate-CoA ligase
MKSLLLESLYFKSPTLIQNIALSAYGYKIDRMHHGGKYSDFFRNVCRQYNFDKNELEDYVNSQIMSLIRDAALDVPYYKELFKRYGLTARDIHSVDDIKKIPLLEKEGLRSDPSRFVSTKYNKNDLVNIHTTGTTGTPLNIYCSPQVRQLNYAYYDRFLSTNSIKHEGKRATFGGRIIVHHNQDKPPFWRYSAFQKNLLFSSYHLTDANMPAYIEKMIDFRPDFIDAYPSSLYAIAFYAKQHNMDLRNVTDGITTSAETLFSEQRKIIESEFGMPVCDQYGAAEMCVFVGQCREGNYHINSDYGLIEFLRDDGTYASEGEEAELVCTGFINPVMPLIRYRIGDRGVLSDRHCKCGSIFPVMESITGRMDDAIDTPDGKKVGRLSPVFKGFPVKEVQFIQVDINSVVVQVVKAEGYTIETERKAILELRKRLGNEISIQMEYVNNIPRGKGGKLRSVISHLKQGP